MKKTLLWMLALLLSFPVLADSDLVTKVSAHDVTATMDRLAAVVAEKGLEVFARIDHEANAHGVDMQMPAAQVLIFGSPVVGTRIMKSDVRAGLDLPLRVLVYQGEDGQTHLAYHDPVALRDTYSLGDNPVPDKVSAALAAITDAASQ